MVARARIADDDVDKIVDEWIDFDFVEQSLEQAEARIHNWQGLRRNEQSYGMHVRNALNHLGFEMGAFTGVNHLWQVMGPVLDALYDEGIEIPGAIELVDERALPHPITMAVVEQAAERIYAMPAPWEADFITLASQYIGMHAQRIEAQESIAREWEGLQSFPPELRDRQWNRWAAFIYALDYIEEVRFARD